MSAAEYETSHDWVIRIEAAGTRFAEQLELKATTQSQSGRTRPRFHVVSTVEDFDTIGRSVRKRLSVKSDVTYSCLWTQYETLNLDPLIEISPIFRAFHDKEPAGPYSLVPVLSDIGSVVPLRAMIIHMAMEERFSRFRSIDIVCPTAFADAPALLRKELPSNLADLVSWSDFVPNPHIGLSGYGSNLGGRTPSEMVGLGNLIEREYHTPSEIQRRIDLRPRRPRPPRSPNPDQKKPVF
ncbi:hypothetical protein EEQ99_32275 [Rhizobium anhuiense]|uniref:Uncharacterized protein n=1 Tax=Rhizobium anhuiense TaxID=1184720 RepID=A0A3S0RXY1_9HYPH|nr:hypothetical protein EEQ99_32275 [Rhizobium anhuiense]